MTAKLEHVIDIDEFEVDDWCTEFEAIENTITPGPRCPDLIPVKRPHRMNFHPFFDIGNDPNRRFNEKVKSKIPRVQVRFKVRIASTHKFQNRVRLSLDY